MITLRKPLSLIALMLALTPGAPSPGVCAPRAVTLEEASAMALENAPELVRAEGERRTSDAGVRTAWGAFLPSLSLSASTSRQLPSGGDRTIVQDGQIVVLPAEPWSRNYGLSAGLQLFSGGARFFELRQARARAEASRFNETAQRFGVLLTVQQRYFEVLAARESESAAAALLAQAEQQLRDSVARLRGKLATRSDSLRSEIQVRNAQLALLDARNAIESASASLTRETGSPEPITATEAPPPEPLLTHDLAELTRMAEEGPLVEQARRSLEEARAGRAGAWSDYLPAISMGYSRGGSGTSEDFTLDPDGLSYTGSMRFSLSFPVFNGFAREARVTQASVTQANAEADLSDAILAAREGVVSAYGVYHSADARLASQTLSLEAAEEDLRVQSLRYTAGQSTLLDVLASQAQLDQARRDLIQARFDLRLARAQLETLVGREL
jgi:outer membrane protein